MTFSNMRRYKGESGHWEDDAIDLDSREVIKAKEKPKRHYKEIYGLFSETLGRKIPLNWTTNVTQQKCAENLFNEHGLQAVENALKFFDEHKEDEYCPNVATPYDLDSKWAKLVAFRKKL